MQKNNLDKETEKILSDGEKIKSTVNSSGWPIIKEKLLRKVAQLLNLSDITDPNPQYIINLIGIRQETAKNLVAWLKEIEGDVTQHQVNAGAFSDVKDEYIINLDQLK